MSRASARCAAELLDELIAKGKTPAVNGGRLDYDAPWASDLSIGDSLLVAFYEDEIVGLLSDLPDRGQPFHGVGLPSDGATRPEPVPEPASRRPPLPASVMDWPMGWQEIWADHAELAQQHGMPWQEADALAEEKVRALYTAGGPPPPRDPGIYEALRRECEAHRHELPGPLRPEGRPTLPDDPLLRWLDTAVSAEQLYPKPLDAEPWACHNPFCFDKSKGWWIGVGKKKLCMNCHPPLDESFVVERGGAAPAALPPKPQASTQPRAESGLIVASSRRG